jgi:hypothetical protein
MSATHLRSPARLLVLTLIVLLANGRLSADTLRIRMIRAVQEASEGVAPALHDVLPVLRSTLAFKSYLLDADATLPLPANGELARVGIYQVLCEGAADRLTVQILHGSRRMLRTVATVRPDQPVILGGFPARPEGTRMFILTVVPEGPPR